MINYTEQEEKANRRAFSDRKGTVLIGALLIIVGAVFIFSNFGVISWGWKHFLISWQMLLIVIGIYCLAKENRTAGLILILTGAFFILPRISGIWPGITLFSHNFTRNFWPLLIIAVGLGLIVTSRRRPRIYVDNSNNSNTNANTGHYKEKVEKADNYDGYINYDYVFSGAEHVFIDPVFKGGTIKTAFGGITLDLRKTTLYEAEPVILKIEATFGGVTIKVPENWNVVIHQNSVFGGFGDKRIRNDYNIGVEGPKLIIEAECTFGGGEVK